MELKNIFQINVYNLKGSELNILNEVYGKQKKKKALAMLDI